MQTRGRGCLRSHTCAGRGEAAASLVAALAPSETPTQEVSQVTGSSRPGGSWVPSFCPIWSRLWSDQDRLRTGRYLGRQTAPLSPSHRYRTGYLLASSSPPPRGAREASWPSAPSNEIRPGSRSRLTPQNWLPSQSQLRPGGAVTPHPKGALPIGLDALTPLLLRSPQGAGGSRSDPAVRPGRCNVTALSLHRAPRLKWRLVAAPACASMPPGRSTGGRLMLHRSACRAA